MSQAIDVTPAQREQLVSLLSTHLPNTEAWVYGSRARWTSRPDSDLDLAVFTTPAQARNVNALREALEESNLPFRVDLFVWDEVPDSFREQIRREHVVLTNATDEFRPRRARVALGELIDLRLSGVDKKSKPNEIPVRLCNYTDVYHNAAIRRDMPFMDATASDREIAKCTLSAGDVVITKDSEQYDDIGVPAYVMDDVPNLVCGYHLAILRPNVTRVDGRYLFYALSTHNVQTQFHHYANGVTRFGLRKADIGLVEIPLPCLPEQHAIANILGTLDDKIELNRRMNKALEAMARALFKSWFVDFEPVRAKMEGRDTSLPDHLAKMFPDALDDQGRPKGWTLQRLDRLFDVSIGRTPPRKERRHFVSSGAGETWLSIKTMGNVQTYAMASEEDLTAEAVERFRIPRIPAGTVMVSFKLTVGRVAIAASDMYSNEAIAHLRARGDTPIASPFTYCSMKGFDYDTLGSTSSIATAVNSQSIKAIEIILPDAATHAAFEAIAQPMFDRILRLSRETVALVNIRRELLPRLVSGEVRVQQAQKAIAAVL